MWLIAARLSEVDIFGQANKFSWKKQVDFIGYFKQCGTTIFSLVSVLYFIRSITKRGPDLMEKSWSRHRPSSSGALFQRRSQTTFLLITVLPTGGNKEGTGAFPITSRSSERQAGRNNGYRSLLPEIFSKA